MAASTTVTDELLVVATETACQAVRAREAVLALRQAADAMADETPPNDASIRQVAKAYGIPVRHRQLRHIALNLTEVLLEEISSSTAQASKTIRAFAPEKSLRSWNRDGLLPQSAYQEAARTIYVARELAGNADEAAKQLERCKLALAYPASLVLDIAQAALAGDTTPMLGAYRE